MENKPKIFGILNVTPDSFSDGGRFQDIEKALDQAQNLFNDGADFIDIGGESTHPGAQELTPKQEWGRIEAIVSKCLDLYPGRVSLDTRKPEIAKNFLELGGTIINDVSGFQDERMIDLAVEYDAVCIVNHFPGTTIAEVHEQKISSSMKVVDDLTTRAEQMMYLGVKKSQIILDPGIGFGKTMELNWELLKFAEYVPEFKVMIGHSKKRFLGQNRFEEEPNREAAKVAINSGASFLRVHHPQWVE